MRDVIDQTASAVEKFGAGAVRSAVAVAGSTL